MSIDFRRLFTAVALCMALPLAATPAAIAQEGEAEEEQAGTPLEEALNDLADGVLELRMDVAQRHVGHPDGDTAVAMKVPETPAEWAEKARETLEQVEASLATLAKLGADPGRTQVKFIDERDGTARVIGTATLAEVKREVAGLAQKVQAMEAKAKAFEAARKAAWLKALRGDKRRVFESNYGDRGYPSLDNTNDGTPEKAAQAGAFSYFVRRTDSFEVRDVYYFDGAHKLIRQDTVTTPR